MKITSAARIFLSSINGWLAVIGQVFIVFALFSLLVVGFRLGLSPIFTTLLEFYYGFREIIFWPFSALFGLSIPDYVRDWILVWSVLGGIAMTTLLWFTSFQNSFASHALRRSRDPERKAAYIAKHGQEKYDEEVAWLEEQVKTTTPPKGLIFNTVTTLIALVSGAFAFIYVAIDNPYHERIGVSARQFMAIQILAILIALAVFCAFNFMLSDGTKAEPSEKAQYFAPSFWQVSPA